VQCSWTGIGQSQRLPADVGSIHELRQLIVLSMLGSPGGEPAALKASMRAELRRAALNWSSTHRLNQLASALRLADGVTIKVITEDLTGARQTEGVVRRLLVAPSIDILESPVSHLQQTCEFCITRSVRNLLDLYGRGDQCLINRTGWPTTLN